MSERRIYVACLASYNNGDLYGQWIDATQDADDIREAIATMLRGSNYPNVMVKCDECSGDKWAIVSGHKTDCPTCKGTGQVPSAEEWAIQDYEGFEGIKLSENPDIDDVATLAATLEEHGEAYAAYVDCVGNDYATPEDFEEKYRGDFDSEKDYAESFVEDCYSEEISKLPDLLKFSIDYDHIAHEMQVGGDVSFIRRGSKVHVFDN